MPTASPTRWISVARTGGLAAAVLLAATGCESGGSRNEPISAQTRSEQTPMQHDEYEKLGYRLQWRGFADVLQGETVEFFDPAEDLLVVQDTASVISVLETSSGERRWSAQAAGRLDKFTGNVRVGNRIVCSSESEVYFFDTAAGTLLDKHNLDTVVNTKPVRVGDVLVYGTSSGVILGHLMLNGFRYWGSSVSSSVSVDPVAVGTGGIVAVTADDGDIRFVDGASGFTVGRNRIFKGPAYSPAASDSAVFVASRDHSLYAFAAQGGAPMWRFRTDAPINERPVFHAGRVYCTVPGRGFTCFNAMTGDVVWSASGQRGFLVAQRADRLLVWTPDASGRGGEAALLDPASGDVIERSKLAEVAMIRPDAMSDGNLYLISPAGVVSKLTPRK